MIVSTLPDSTIKREETSKQGRVCGYSPIDGWYCPSIERPLVFGSQCCVVDETSRAGDIAVGMNRLELARK